MQNKLLKIVDIELEKICQLAVASSLSEGDIRRMKQLWEMRQSLTEEISDTLPTLDSKFTKLMDDLTPEELTELLRGALDKK